MKRKYDDIEMENSSLSKLGEEKDNSSSILNDNIISKKPLIKSDREEVKTFIRIKPIENDPGKILFTKII